MPPITGDEIPYDLPEGWVWCRLGFLGSVRGGKRIPKGKSFSRFPTEHIYIRVTDMKNGTIIKDDVHYIDDEVFNLISKYTISQNDLYITIAGTIGACGIVPPEFDKMNLTENAAKITLFGAEKLYLVNAISSPLVQGQFLEKTNQMAQPKLALERIATTLIPLPPLSEQQRIVAKVDELMVMCGELETAEKELDALEEHLFDYLPKSILQAAVQGKLVPQDKNDEPASELLKRIQAEKATLIKEGELKKEKPLPPITEDEMPYDLPDGWAWCRLGDIANLRIGKTPARAEEKYWNNGKYPWVSIADMTSGKHITQTKEKVSAEAFVDVFKEVLVPVGSLLFSFKLSIGKVSVLDISALTNEAICAITPYGSFFISEYLFKVLPVLNLLVDAKDAIKGKTLNSKSISRIMIPLPPLAEQQRIVAQVNELMAMCDELKRVAEQPINHDNVIPFPAEPKENIEPIAMAARGKVEGMSEQAKQAIEDLFGED